MKLLREGIRVVRSVRVDTWKLLIIAFVMFVIPTVLFVELADEVLEQETTVFDEAILRAINAYQSPTLDTIVTATTDLGYVWWVGIFTIIALIVCIKKKQYLSALIVIVGIVGSASINLLLKGMFQRDRPQLWERLVTENSFSFPSGHAMASASLAAVIVVLLWPTRWRWYAVAGGVCYMLYIGFTRMYLGVHYPTDVAAGWLVAIAWVALSTIIIKRIALRRQSEKL
ncbi:MAG: phosphatase PAP2 family protein [Candidatus Saccharimonadales bacterium]